MWIPMIRFKKRDKSLLEDERKNLSLAVEDFKVAVTEAAIRDFNRIKKGVVKWLNFITRK